MHLKSAVVAAFAILASTNVQAAPVGDACTAASKQASTAPGWIDYENAVTCLDSFPLDDEIRRATIDTLLKTVEGEYSFVDMAAVGSTIDGEKWDVPNLDLRKRLKEMETKAYSKDRQFHDELIALFRLLGDAHTGYQSGCYHQAFTFSHPWLYNVLVNSTSGQQYVQLGDVVDADPTFASKIQTAIKHNPKDLVGYIITAIEGKNPIEWIMDFANTKVGLAKDKMTRFNRATARLTVNVKGEIGRTAGPVTLNSRMEAPEKATRTLKLRAPNATEEITVDVPWFAKHNRASNYTDSKTFYTNNCLAPKTSTLKTRGLDSDSQTTGLIDVTAEEFLVLDAAAPGSGIPTFPNKTENSYGNGFPKMLKNGFYSTFHLIDAETGVAHVPTFDSSNGDPNCKSKLFDPEAVAAIGTGGPAGDEFFCFIQEINEGLQTLKKAGAKKLVLDWTDNGGGWGDLGFATVALLFPNVERDVARFRMSPLSRVVFKEAFANDLNQTTPLTMFGPANFLDPKTGLPPLSTDIDRLFLSPQAGRDETYGAYTSRYSELVSIVDGGGIFNASRPHNTWNATGIPPPTVPLFPVENVMLLTNGLCGSTCAHAARLAVDHVGIKSVVKGGLAGSKPFTFSTFPGGNVVDIPQIFNDLKALNLSNHELAPQPFKNNVGLWRVNAGVGYSKRQDLPAEYAYAPADCRMDITEETVYPPNAWRAAAGLFNGCKNGNGTDAGNGNGNGTTTTPPTYGTPPAGYPTGAPGNGATTTTLPGYSLPASQPTNAPGYSLPSSGAPATPGYSAPSSVPTIAPGYSLPSGGSPASTPGSSIPVDLPSGSPASNQPAYGSPEPSYPTGSGSGSNNAATPAYPTDASPAYPAETPGFPLTKTKCQRKPKPAY